MPKPVPAPLLRRVLIALAAGLVASAGAAAAPQAQEPAAVFTRARLVSTYEESGGRLYVRLKLLPRAKIPFTTQSFRVVDRSLLAGLPDGTWVKFTAKHLDGENTLTSIHAAEECQRFRPCD